MMYTPTHTAPNKSHLGEGLRAESLPFSGHNKIVSRTIYSHQRQTGGILRDGVPPISGARTGTEATSHHRGEALLDRWELAPFLPCRGQRHQELFGYAASVSKIRERGFLPGPPLLRLFCIR